jgi:hypothetical protein
LVAFNIAFQSGAAAFSAEPWMDVQPVYGKSKDGFSFHKPILNGVELVDALFKADSFLTLPVDKPLNPKSEWVRSWSPTNRSLNIKCALRDPVKAAAVGEVLYTGWYGGYGKVVILKHEQNLVTLYAHLSSASVEKGQKVAQGEDIGLVGPTRSATGPNLHFAILREQTCATPTQNKAD